MSIVLGGLDTGSALHGSIKSGVWQFSRSTQTFFGVTGEYHLQGRLHGRDLTAWCWPSGYASHELLQTAIEAINAFIGTYGTMTCTIGTAKTFANCIFDGFEIEEDPWYDGSGVNGWQVKGTLKFRQIKT